MMRRAAAFSERGSVFDSTVETGKTMRRKSMRTTREYWAYVERQLREVGYSGLCGDDQNLCDAYDNGTLRFD